MKKEEIKVGELRNLSSEELEQRGEEFKRELFNLRFQLSTGQLEKTHQIAFLRKGIARINTLLHERAAEQTAEASQT